MKIFVCRKCERYCNVEAGMISDCCLAEVFVPQHEREKEKQKVNPAV